MTIPISIFIASNFNFEIETTPTPGAKIRKPRANEFRRKQASDFLDKVIASVGDRAVKIVAERICWRARLGCEYEEVTKEEGYLKVIYEEERPYSTSAMKPIWQSEGRANPRGIPYLYLATRRETALSEVRPWIARSRRP